ncbi:hypothetical protein ACFFQF_12970 [Haladaptatus pallidirubidus]|uniref:Uncharacterized protein n=1 Tax=Haladaptatus pallidirubidus TaxID=1008152 RepID=A0AAV3UD89_9EURY|nr:hypothetical protein [Haladaptatus pallidirubidus]
MTSSLAILYDGPERYERESFLFDDDRDPAFSDETMYYEKETGHWVVRVEELSRSSDVPISGEEALETTPVSIRIPGERMYWVSKSRPHEPSDGPQPVEPTPPTYTVVTKLVSEDGPDVKVLDNRRLEVLKKPTYDAETDHWRCRVHDINFVEGKTGLSDESTVLIPREKVYYVYECE